MRRERKQRFAAVVLLVCLMGSMLAEPTRAIKVDPESTSNGWSLATGTADVQTVSRGDAYTWITGKMNDIAQSCNTALDATSEPNRTEILSWYGAYLAYASWVCGNVSIEESDSSKQWTIFQGPGDFDSVTAAELLDNAEILRAKIVEKGIIPSVTDISAKSYNASSAVSLTLPSSSDLLTEHGMAGERTYHTAFQRLLSEYVDGSILVILANRFGVTGTSKTALKAALAEHFPTEWYDETVAGNPPPEMISLATELKSDLQTYLEVMNQCLAAYRTASGKALMSETLEIGEERIYVKGYTYSFDGGSNIEDSCSIYTRALYKYLYSAETGESQGKPPPLESVDLSNGALPIMANAKILNGEVVMEGEPELTTIGYYVLSAGVVYDPFVSVAGDDTYLATLREFLKTSEQEEQLVRVLQSAINTKKPLYVTDGSRDEWTRMDSVEEIPVSEYRIAYLSDMLQIQDKITRAYAVARGKMRASTVDSSTWEYIRGGAANNGVENNGDNSMASGVIVDSAGTSGSNSTTIGTQELMASGSQMSKPLAFTSGSDSIINSGTASSFVAGVGGMTAMIIQNAAVDSKGNKYLEAPERQMLFLNGLGDIVLQDGTIVLPAIANPALYDYFGTTTNDQDDSATGMAATGYYPYSATFVNHYPMMRIAADKTVTVANTKDVGKYLVSNNGGDYKAMRIYQIDDGGKARTKITDWVKVPVMASDSFSVTADITDIRGLFTAYDASVGNAFLQWWRYGDTSPSFVVYNPAVNAEGISFFPLVEDNPDVRESYLGVAGPLVTSAVRYLSTATSGNTTTRQSSGVFRIQGFIEDYMGEGMQGTAYSETLVKNYQMDYEALVADQYGRFTLFIKNWVTDVLNTLGHIDGVLAIKNGYENGFFNMLMGFIQESYLIIAVVLLIIVAVKFLKGHYNLLYVVMIGCLVFCAFEVYAVWMPTAVPAAYNFFVNDLVEDTVWNTVTVKAESYEETYRDSSRKDPITGALRPYTATITLYKMTQGEMEQVCERTGANIIDVRSGTPVFLDQDAGIFVQGDSIKMSIDKLLANNSMRGLYASQWEQVDTDVEEVEPIDTQLNDNPYIIKLTNPYVSLESYYTPFCQIERAFLVNLNNFANIFRIERNYYRYGAYVYKDAFLFNAFTNSGIFTKPGDDEVLRNNIREESIMGSNTATADEIIELCNRYFTPQNDWLNLRSVFAVPSRAMRDSLWGQMLQREGYYDSDWNMSPEQEEKMVQLILYINEQTKQFVIRNQEQLNFCSDENAIKLTALFATTAFTHRVSSFGYWLYPNYINAGDIELVDVLYGAMTTLSDRNAASNGDIVNTVTLNLGVPGALLVLMITLLSVLFVFVLTYLIPILYALFGIVMIYKLINDEQSIGLVKGYVKVTVVSTVLYVAYSAGLKLVRVGGYAWYGYLGTAIVTALCLYFLFSVVISVVANPLEMGNDTLMRNLFGAIDRLTGGRLGRLTANSISIQSRNMYGQPGYGSYQGYARSASVDDRYSSRRPRRGQHYGRWEDFDDDSMSTRARVINRFGNIAAHADEVGSTRTGFRQTRVMRGVRSVGRRLGNITWHNSEGTALGDRFENFRSRRR